MSAHSRTSLSGPEKVGLLLLAIGKERADTFLQHFDPEELNAIMRSTESMPTIGTLQLENIVGEFEERLGSGLPFLGKGEDVKRLVSNALLTSRSSAGEGGEEERQDVWSRLATCADDLILNYITKLHPQLAAHILQRLGSERSALLLRLMPPALRNSLIARLLAMKDVLPATADAIEKGIAAELFEADKGSSDKCVAVAAILNSFEKQESSESLEFIAAERPRDAEAIRKLLFKFEDLTRLAPKALTVLMDGVPVERVVIALQGMDTGFQQKVLMALSPRARRMAEAELQGGATALPRDITQSRRAIADTVLKLVAEGVIDLTASASVE